MAIFNLFSKRQKRLRGDVPDVYLYDKIPKPLRVQIVQILREVLGDEKDYKSAVYGTYDYPRVRGAYKFINQTLCREYGVFSLADYPNRECVVKDIFEFFLNEQDCDKVLDVIELSFKAIDVLTRERGYKNEANASEKADAAINELNARFKEHGVGYEYRNGELIRVDSELIHAEAVKPALILLSEKFIKAQMKSLCRLTNIIDTGVIKIVLLGH